MIAWSAFVFGIILGGFISFIFVWRFICLRYIGNLRFDRSDPDDPPYLFLEIRHNKQHLIKASKYVIMRVKVEDYIPRE